MQKAELYFALLHVAFMRRRCWLGLLPFIKSCQNATVYVE